MTTRTERLRYRRKLRRYHTLAFLLLFAGLAAGLLIVDLAYGEMTQEESLLAGAVADTFASVWAWFSDNLSSPGAWVLSA